MDLFMKYLLAALLLILLVSCGGGQSVQILPGACKGSDTQGFTITGSDDESELCLVTGSEEEVLGVRWSEDGSVFAYAVLDVTKTQPALSGRMGYYRPPATHWYIAGGDGRNVRPFPVADNHGLSFSPDGKYAIIKTGCYYATCERVVYLVAGDRKVCEYETETVWFGKSDCPELTLENGQIWDIRRIKNDSGCAYYETNGWGTPEVCTTVTPTPDIDSLLP